MSRLVSLLFVAFLALQPPAAPATPKPKAKPVDTSRVQQPKSKAAPAGASAQCRDGTYSFSKSRRGTCSHHGGVSTWL
jgi:hypothetical protein